MLPRTSVPPLAEAELKRVRIKHWGNRRAPQRFEYLGGLVAPKHTVLEATVANTATTIVSRVLLFQEKDGTLTKLLTPDRNAVAGLERVLMDLTKLAPVSQPMESAAFVRCQNTARKQKRMQMALESLTMKDLSRQDAEIKAFGKKEKLKYGKPLRIIQGRTDRYLFSLGRWIKPMEKGLYTSIDRVLGYKAVMKGLNGVERAAIVRQGWEAIDKPCAVSVDIEKFDASVSKPVLEVEHKPYIRCGRGDVQLAKMLRWQLKNKGRATCVDGAVKYSREGGRMSGDPNTSLGNILICTATHVMYCREQGIPFRLANDGDDSVLIISQRHLRKFLAGLDAHWRSLGFRIKVDNVAMEFSEIDFCQCRPVMVDGVWCFVRNPATALQKDLVNTVVATDDTERRAWYAAVGDGGLSQYEAVPMYSSFYKMLQRLGEKNTVNYQWRAAMQKTALYQRSGLSGKEVSAETRVSFWKAYGINAVQQRAFEAACDSFQPSTIPDHQGPPPLTILTDLLK